MAGEPTFGTPGTATARRLMLLGSGELGKEVLIEAQRYGIETIAVDRYSGAPAMQVAHRHHVIDMTDANALRAIVEKERPHWIVPEIEAIATGELETLEADGYHVVPTAQATRLTMDREGIRVLAADQLGIPTSPFRFASSLDEMRAAVDAIGVPCVIKPTMSSSGKGQSTVHTLEDVAHAWNYATEGSRTKTGRVIVEGFVPFDYEITLLTIRHANGTTFCRPIGHTQEDGDYRESWQPMPMSDAALEQAKDIAARVTEALGGWGLFGVELFIRGDQVLFSEVSPRPHDTGLVTMATQSLSEFALHVRAITGLPIPADEEGFVPLRSPGASAVVLSPDDLVTQAPAFAGIERALANPDVELRVFGKPETKGRRRMAVAIAVADETDAARAAARDAASCIRVSDGAGPEPDGKNVPTTTTTIPA